MDFKAQFDAPLPKISKDTETIYIETPGSCNGDFTIRNIGGGVICGHILSNSRVITFEPKIFSGNDSLISFHVNMEMYNIGDAFTSEAVIMSNGGEHTIVFIVRMVPYAIETKEGIKITGMDEFFSYASEYSLSARQIFSRHEFSLWLYSSGYEYMDIYEKFVADSNKERALENFFVFNNYKKRPCIRCEERNIDIKLEPFSTDVYAASIVIHRDSWGHVDESITSTGGDWIRLEKNRLETSDFDNMTACISFFIDPLKLKGRLNMGSIKIGRESVGITVIKKSYIQVSLERENLKFRDQSYILIKNNSGSRITVDILPADEFVKFESIRYFVNENAKIPFQVEISTIKVAQLSLTKQPEINSYIEIDSVYNKESFKKKLNLFLNDY